MTALVYLILLATPSGAADPGVVGCPKEEEVHQTLQVDKSWQVTCNAKHGDVLMAGVLGPEVLNASPRIALAMVHEGVFVRTALDLSGPDEAQIRKIPAEDWIVSVRFQSMGADRWIRVDVVGRAGEDLFTAQGVVSFFVVDGERLVHLWTGLGDRAETRFDACQLDTATRFRLLEGRTLERRWRSFARFRDPGGTSEDLIKSLRKECVAQPSKVEKFRLPLETSGGG
jgi:hypothetical protein